MEHSRILNRLCARIKFVQLVGLEKKILTNVYFVGKKSLFVVGIEHTRIGVRTHGLTNRAISAYEQARIYCDKYMDLGGYLVKRASREENFKGLV